MRALIFIDKETESLERLYSVMQIGVFLYLTCREVKLERCVFVFSSGGDGKV